MNFLRPLITAGLQLMKSVLTPLAKSILLPFGLSAAMSATDATIPKKNHGSGITALIISNEEMEEIMEIVKSLEESGLLINGMRKKSKNVYKVLNYTKHFLILISAGTGCITISAFASLVGIPIGITSSAIVLKSCERTGGIKKYQ